MRVMNKRMNLPNMQKILMEFEKQNERMDMTSEMMGDAIDDAMEVRDGRGESSLRKAGEVLPVAGLFVACVFLKPAGHAG
jgi:charged multivesicular body protein 2A